MEPGASAQCTDAQHPGCRLDSSLAWLERVTEQFLKEHEAVQAWQTKAKDMSQQELCRLPCWRAKPHGVRAPTETTCSMRYVILRTYLHRKSQTESPTKWA